VASAGLEGMFSHVLSVDEVKIYKPTPRVYQLACDRMGLATSAIGFVSSNYWDVAGARNFGFWTCWVNRLKAPPDELGFIPEATAQTLTDLVNAVKA